MSNSKLFLKYKFILITDRIFKRKFRIDKGIILTLKTIINKCILSGWQLWFKINIVLFDCIWTRFRQFFTLLLILFFTKFIILRWLQIVVFFLNLKVLHLVVIIDSVFVWILRQIIWSISLLIILEFIQIVAFTFILKLI